MRITYDRVLFSELKRYWNLLSLRNIDRNHCQCEKLESEWLIECIRGGKIKWSREDEDGRWIHRLIRDCRCHFLCLYFESQDSSLNSWRLISQAFIHLNIRSWIHRCSWGWGWGWGWGWNDLRIFQWNFQSWHELRRQRVLQVIKQTSESLMLTSDTTARKFDCANFSLYHSAREKPLLNERKNDWLFSSFEWKSSSHLYPFYI